MLFRPAFLSVPLLSLGRAACLRRNPLFVLFAPRFEGGEDGGEAHAQLRERVFDSRWDLGVGGSRDQPAIGHRAQIGCEHLLRDSAHGTLQFAESACALEQVPNDEDAPPAGDEAERDFHRAVRETVRGLILPRGVCLPRGAGLLRVGPGVRVRGMGRRFLRGLRSLGPRARLF